MASIEVDFIDNASIGFRHSDRDPDGELFQPTLGAAKEYALMTARSNRDAWARCVRSIRETRLADVEAQR